MVITEAELREMWRNGRQPLPAFPPATRFTPAAQDFLKAHRLEARFADPAATPTPADPGPVPPAWDHQGAFPVALTGPVPVCAACGQPLPHKPEHLTQVDAGHFAPKSAPRVKLRGRIDSLRALVLLAAAEARRYQLPALAVHLDTLGVYCRELQSAEYHGRAAAPLTAAGYTEDELRAVSRQPDQHLGVPHQVPGARDHAILHWLNLLRAHAREVEIEAQSAYPPNPADPTTEPGASLAGGLKRLSSAVYVLELLFRTGRLAWKAAPSAP